ncbi:hypothetical protein [Chryseobacterium sp. MFBS3-17]|uniref:hypothetical protein n=1 Tax=Chryseobacterium sp. MFBS3-17 TaxID=2886689 RepID=UPI001D0ED27C|nr:hypothetical protein [Chryseobacterium sp. MFBS3-17]MCC2589847.1 hypothetical protein [Chryseobacterium sp. MFBS3-17]
MKKSVFVALIAILVVQCKEKKEKLKNDHAADSMAVNTSEFDIEAIPESCYMAASGKDSLFVKYSDNLGTITGKMHYKNFEKDSSSGDIVGMFDGDTLKVDYTFQAEGTQSTREIWFLKKDDQLIEGIGEYDESGETYKDGAPVKFEGQKLQTADCKTFGKHLK